MGFLGGMSRAVLCTEPGFQNNVGKGLKLAASSDTTDTLTVNPVSLILHVRYVGVRSTHSCRE